MNEFHGHVVTGDLDIIRNDALRTIMKKGAKYRDSADISLDRLQQSIINDIKKFKSIWTERERSKAEEEDKESWDDKLDNWESTVCRIVKNKIHKLVSEGSIQLNGSSILQREDVRNEIRRLHYLYIITSVDKAANNFSVRCKKFYYKYGCQELGILNGGNGNETYQKVNKTLENVVNDLKRELSRKKLPSNFVGLPRMYWIVKFHKNPVKFRPISGSKNKVLSGLEKILGCALKMLTKHFINYCGRTESLTGFKHYFAIKNSLDTIKILNTLKSKATSFDSYDFSDLYTKFDHSVIEERLCWLVNTLFKHNGKEFINVWNNLKRCEYSKDALNQVQGWSFKKDDIKSAIKFLLSNTFISFGNYVLRQIKGVPMGAIPSPDLASLSLSVDEYRFVSEKLKVKAFAILRKMNQVCRYLDDIGVPNFTDFDQYLADIYRGNLTILKSNDNSVLNVAYLDLSINVLEQDFVMKVYCKTDEYTFEVISLPFLESNVDEGMCYSVYFSQILRFIRICSRKDDFIERSKLLSDMLMARGYLKGRLSTKLNQVLSKYQQDWAKFGSGLLPHELTRRILYN